MKFAVWHDFFSRLARILQRHELSRCKTQVFGVLRSAFLTQKYRLTGKRLWHQRQDLSRHK